jgi:hypothetical protein
MFFCLEKYGMGLQFVQKQNKFQQDMAQIHCAHGISLERDGHLLCSKFWDRPIKVWDKFYSKPFSP